MSSSGGQCYICNVGIAFAVFQNSIECARINEDMLSSASNNDDIRCKDFILKLKFVLLQFELHVGSFRIRNVFLFLYWLRSQICFEVAGPEVLL